MKKLNINKLEIFPSSIGKIMSLPSTLRRTTDNQYRSYRNAIKVLRQANLKNIKTPPKASSIKSAKEEVAKYKDKRAKLSNPKLTETAKNHLADQYAYQLYQMPYVSTGNVIQACREKGTVLEEKALKLVSKLDGIEYIPVCDEKVSNGWLTGKCDGITKSKDKIVEIKVSYTASAFLDIQYKGEVNKDHWWQMQGYLWLYNVPYGEIKYVLLNTPENLVERELERYKNRLMNDEITRDEYELRVEKLNTAFDYELIPEERRVVTVQVFRDEKSIRAVKKRIKKCREFLKELQEKHLKNQVLVSSYSQYDPLAIGKEEQDNTSGNSAG